MRSVNCVLYDALGSRRVTEELLGATLCLLEHALSFSPITPVTTNSRELAALTANRFLLGQRALSFPSLLPGINLNTRRKRTCERSCTLTNASCFRGFREYFPLLNNCVKWHTQSEFTPKTGDLRLRTIDLV